jgi:hypothetical protein
MPQRFAKQGGGRAAVVIGAALVLIIVGVILIVKTSKDGTQTASRSTATSSANQPAHHAQHQPGNKSSAWRRINTLDHNFSLAVPDGWKIVDATNGNLIKAQYVSSIHYQPGTPAKIQHAKVHGFNDLTRFVAFEAGQSPVMPGSSTSSFRTSHGASGQRFVKHFTSAPQSGDSYVKGQTLYGFYVTQHGTYYCVLYNHLPDEPDQSARVAKIAKSIMLP